jgi:hypothetical protein
MSELHDLDPVYESEKFVKQFLLEMKKEITDLKVETNSTGKEIFITIFMNTSWISTKCGMSFQKDTESVPIVFCVQIIRNRKKISDHEILYGLLINCHRCLDYSFPHNPHLFNFHTFKEVFSNDDLCDKIYKLIQDESQNCIKFFFEREKSQVIKRFRKSIRNVLKIDIPSDEIQKVISEEIVRRIQNS